MISTLSVSICVVKMIVHRHESIHQRDVRTVNYCRSLARMYREDAAMLARRSWLDRLTGYRFDPPTVEMLLVEAAYWENRANAYRT